MKDKNGKEILKFNDNLAEAPEGKILTIIFCYGTNNFSLALGKKEKGIWNVYTLVTKSVKRSREYLLHYSEDVRNIKAWMEI